MESLLPASKYKSPSYSSIASKSIGTVSNHQQLMVVWPGEYINDFIESNDPQTLKNGTIKKAAKSQEEMAKQQLQTHVDKQMTVQLLKAIHGDSVKWQPGKYNSTLVIRQPDQLKHAVQDQIDSDMIAHNTRQLAKKWLEMVNNASGLSQYLVELNAYRLPVNQLRKDLSVLDGWDDDNWETASETLLPWLYQD
jgi:hypothetical protein